MVLPRQIESCWYVIVLGALLLISIAIMFVVVSVMPYPIPRHTAARLERRM